MCRAMKVGKEEVIGFLTASETWLKNDLNALNREWNARIQPISTLVKPGRSRPTLLFQRPGTGTETLAHLLGSTKAGNRRHGQAKLELVSFNDSAE